MADKQRCHYCQQQLPGDDLRPYGPGGSMVCNPCVRSSPERNQAAVAVYYALLDAADAMSPEGAVTIGGSTGPQPVVLDEDPP